MSGTERPRRVGGWRRSLVSLEAAAVTGMAFAVLFVASVVLMRSGLPDWDAPRDEIQAVLEDGDAQWAVVAGFSLVPFAAIAFLWFVAVLRRRIPAQDRFVSTVFVSAGTVFVTLYLVAASLLGGPAYVQLALGTAPLDANLLLGLQSVAYGLMFVIGTRIQVLVVLSATAMGRFFGVLPRWLVYFGYLVAVIQVVNVALFDLMVFTFPVWVLAVSAVLLVKGRDGD